MRKRTRSLNDLLTTCLPSKYKWYLLLITLLFVELTLLFGGGILVLLIFRHQVIHVALGLSELHLVHSLPSVPMQESLATKHSREILGDSLEHLLDRRGVAGESHRHFQAFGGNVAHGRLDVVRDPLNEVR